MVALPFTFYVSWSHTTTPCSQTNSVRLDFWEMYTDPRRFTSNLRWLCTRARHEDTFKATFTLQKLGWMVNEMSCEECLLDMKMSHIYRMVHEFKSSFSNNIVIVSIRLATKYHLLSSDVYICSFLQLRKLQFFFGGGRRNQKLSSSDQLACQSPQTTEYDFYTRFRILRSATNYWSKTPDICEGVCLKNILFFKGACFKHYFLKAHASKK